MRAEKFRGSRIRSPSSQNELNRIEICQEARQRRAFFFFSISTRVKLYQHTLCPVILRARACGRLERFEFVACHNRQFAITPALVAAKSTMLQGLPCSNEQKKTRVRSHLSA